MGRPSIILKEILSSKEWDLIRTVYMLHIMTEEDMKQKLGANKFNTIRSRALQKIFENEEATDYFRRYTNQDVFQRLSSQNDTSLRKSFLSNQDHPLTKEYLSSLSHEKQIVAQYYLGIGTCQFCNVSMVIQKLREQHITKSYGDIAKVSQEIIEDMCDPKYRDAFLILSNQHCNSALIHRIHTTILGEKKEETPKRKDSLETKKEKQKEKVTVPDVPVTNILEQILTEKEYEVLSLLYLDKKPIEKADLERKMGRIPFSYYFHSALRKINQSEIAKYYMMSHVKVRQEKELVDAFASIPFYHGDLRDPNNPFTQDLLAKYSRASRFVAAHHLGIGTGEFLSLKTVAKMMTSNPSWENITDEATKSLAKSALKEIAKYGYTEDYYALLITCPDKTMREDILNILGKLLHAQIVEKSSQSKISPCPTRRKPGMSLDELYEAREKERVTANLKRGYLFSDMLLNVTDLSEEKEATIKAMTHHEGLLQLVKKSHRMGGIKPFSAIAIFINFVDDQAFSVEEIASIIDCSLEEVSTILHTKMNDFISLLPGEMKKSHAQKLSFS